ncbi:kinase-like domain-containing protein [Cladochytrium replicatum]|nr:kinase-like domain-containing protein [Cladochytrium replicatum]
MVEYSSIGLNRRKQKRTENPGCFSWIAKSANITKYRRNKKEMSAAAQNRNSHPQSVGVKPVPNVGRHGFLPDIIKGTSPLPNHSVNGHKDHSLAPQLDSQGNASTASAHKGKYFTAESEATIHNATPRASVGDAELDARDGDLSEQKIGEYPGSVDDESRSENDRVVSIDGDEVNVNAQMAHAGSLARWKGENKLPETKVCNKTASKESLDISSTIIRPDAELARLASTDDSVPDVDFLKSEQTLLELSTVSLGKSTLAIDGHELEKFDCESTKAPAPRQRWPKFKDLHMPPMLRKLYSPDAEKDKTVSHSQPANSQSVLSTRPTTVTGNASVSLPPAIHSEHVTSVSRASKPAGRGLLRSPILGRFLVSKENRIGASPGSKQPKAELVGPLTKSRIPVPSASSTRSASLSAKSNQNAALPVSSIDATSRTHTNVKVSPAKEVPPDAQSFIEEQLELEKELEKRSEALLLDGKSDDEVRRDAISKAAFENKYIVLKKLGSGGHSVVRLGRRIDDDEQVVCKFIRQASVWHWHQDSHTGRKIPLEIHLLKKFSELGHPGLIKYYEHYECMGRYVIIMEYLGGDWVDLYDYIELYGPVVEEETRIIFKQIVETVKYLHRIGYSHNDIKDENIMINTKTKQVKLIDFGSATALGPGTTCKHFYGTKKFAAPEALSGDPYPAATQEVWALGTLLYVLLFKMDPFKTDEEVVGMELSRRITRLRNLGRSNGGVDISDDAVDALAVMLHKDHTRRIKMEEILRLRFLQSSRRVRHIF